LQPKYRDRGLTLLLPGIDAPHAVHAAALAGLQAGGVRHQLEVHDWTTGLAPLMLVHLRSTDRHKEQAVRLATRIMAYRQAYPQQPLNLVAHSGGCGVVLLAAEYLPPEVQVTRMVLLAPAVSARRDLTAALAHSELGVWNYWSRGDVPLAFLGTTVAGTFDGRHAPSAGAIGFRPPRVLAHKYHDRPWNLQQFAQGHAGGHFGALSYFFMRDELAPLLCHDAVPVPKGISHGSP
jgi:pimeloyl-ACP methyl ester carboxylesterase